MTYGQLIDRVLGLAGSDLTRADAGRLVNDAYRDLCALSRWLHLQASLGPVAPAQTAYPLPDTVLVDVRAVSIRGGIAPQTPTGSVYAEFERRGPDELAGLKSGRLTLQAGDYAGIFAPAWDYIAGAYVELYPPPDDGYPADAQVWAESVGVPGNMTDEAASPVVPLDYHADIARRAFAEGLILYDERQDLAAPIIAAFEARAEMLRRRRNSQVGSGSFRAAIVGVDG